VSKVAVLTVTWDEGLCEEEIPDRAHATEVLGIYPSVRAAVLALREHQIELCGSGDDPTAVRDEYPDPGPWVTKWGHRDEFKGHTFRCSMITSGQINW